MGSEMCIRDSRITLPDDQVGQIRDLVAVGQVESSIAFLKRPVDAALADAAGGLTGDTSGLIVLDSVNRSLIALLARGQQKGGAPFSPQRLPRPLQSCKAGQLSPHEGSSTQASFYVLSFRPGEATFPEGWLCSGFRIRELQDGRSAGPGDPAQASLLR